jgi:hypothetical protein
MRSRWVRVRLLVVLGLVMSGLTVAAAAPSAAGSVVVQRWCASTAPPCVVSASRDGTLIGPDGDTTYTVTWPWWGDTGGASTPDDRFWQVVKNGGYDLGSGELGHVFEIDFDLGGLDPRAVWGWANPVGSGVQRHFDAGTGHWMLTLTLQPVRRISACNASTSPPVCPTEASAEQEVHAQLYGDISNGAWWSDTEAVRDQVNGLNSFTNVDYTYEQPDIAIDSTTGAATMTIPMANAHAFAGGEVFQGFQKVRLPNRMLREVYGIPNPETMTPDSLASTVTGGAGTIHTYQEAGDDAMHVDVLDVTFSLRRLKVRTGTIVPTRPGNVQVRRTATHRGRISFTAATPRGAKVTGYEARCVAADNHSGAGAAAFSAQPLVLTRLQAGMRYFCQVRANSKAGPGRWSATVTMPARPPA